MHVRNPTPSSAAPLATLLVLCMALEDTMLDEIAETARALDRQGLRGEADALLGVVRRARVGQIRSRAVVGAAGVALA